MESETEIPHNLTTTQWLDRIAAEERAKAAAGPAPGQGELAMGVGTEPEPEGAHDVR